jgi:PKD repeat protein
VTDFVTGDPLEGVLVTVMPARNHILGLTDPNGYYSMTLPAGDYQVTAELTGYETQTKPATVAVSETTVVDFVLVPVVVPPEIDVTPSAISVTLVSGESSLEPVTVTNLGGSPLNFAVTNPEAVTWLSFEPLNGILDPSASLDISVTLDAAALDAGVYTATLEFASNDPITPLVILPVTLTVLPACVPVSGTDFSWIPPAPIAGEVVTFTASVTGSEPISFFWDFGDGFTATGETVAHSFASGVYTVTLTASNACGVDEISYNITVASPSLWVYLPLVSKH